jgi:hypothetical protein
MQSMFDTHSTIIEAPRQEMTNAELELFCALQKLEFTVENIGGLPIDALDSVLKDCREILVRYFVKYHSRLRGLV